MIFSQTFRSTRKSFKTSSGVLFSLFFFHLFSFSFCTHTKTFLNSQFSRKLESFPGGKNKRHSKSNGNPKSKNKKIFWEENQKRCKGSQPSARSVPIRINGSLTKKFEETSCYIRRWLAAMWQSIESGGGVVCLMGKQMENIRFTTYCVVHTGSQERCLLL